MRWTGVLSAQSRFVNPEQARQIVMALPPFITTVGLFVNAEPATVRAILDVVPLALLQFTATKNPTTALHSAGRISKPCRWGLGLKCTIMNTGFATAAGLLLDSFHGGAQTGGSGQGFDWVRIPAERHKPLILAGGLYPGNVAAAIRQVRPEAVDVSSGVESAKGIRNSELIRAFLREVHDGESNA